MSKDNQTEQCLKNNLKCEEEQRVVASQVKSESEKDKEPEEELFFWAEPGVCG